MKSSTLIWVIVIIVIILLGGWYFFSHNPSSPAAQYTVNTSQSAANNAPAQQTSQGNPVLGSNNNATLGTYLVAANAMTLYKYTKDTNNVSNCTGQCAVMWPPYTVADQSNLSNVKPDVKGSVGTITRADGTLQVTYNGMPLYFYNKDATPGDTTGQGVGGVWFVVAP